MTVDQPAGTEVDLAARLDALTAAVEDVRRELKNEGDRAAARERIIDRLHEDNQKLRAGDRQLVLRPILSDVQRLRNDLLRQAASVPADISADAVAALLRSYAQEAELTLERGGVAVLHPAPGDAFDPGRMRPQSVSQAPGPEQDGTVAELIADGYFETVTQKVLSPATVKVYKNGD